MRHASYPQETFYVMLQSASYKATILDPFMTHIGTAFLNSSYGSSNYYWVLSFGDYSYHPE